MTYGALKLEDIDILNVLEFYRREGAMPMVHAENADCIKWLSSKMLDRGLTHPRYKGMVHNRIVEREAAGRAIGLAELADVPLFIVHVATAEAAEEIRLARSQGLTIIGEMCPQYLVLTEHDLEKSELEAGKCICAPPPQSDENRKELWRHLETGTFQLFRLIMRRSGSIHRPASSFRGRTLRFPASQVGFPGLSYECLCYFRRAYRRVGSRLATSLHGRYECRLDLRPLPEKETTCVGADADLAVWELTCTVRALTDILHDEMDCTPYDGIEISGWPIAVFSRGES